MDFLKEQGCNKRDIDALNSRMDDFSANSTLVGSVALAKTANKVTGRAEMEGIRKSKFISDKDYNKAKVTDGFEKTFKLNVMANQTMLKAKFGNEIELSRGIVKKQARDVIGAAKGGKVDVGVGAVSSWTGNAGIANSFAVSGTGKSSGAVLTAKFKTSSVMDSHYTNPTFRRMKESEFLIMGTSSVRGAALSKSRLAKDIALDGDIWAR